MKKVLDFVKNFTLNFLKTRTVAYYIASGVAFIAWIMGIVCTSSLAFAGASAVPMVLVSLGGLVFIVGSLFGEEKIGAGMVAFASYGALIATFCELYAHFLTEIQSQAMTGFDLGAMQGFSTLIACVVLFLVCAIAANVLAFLKLNKNDKIKKQKKEVIEAEAVTDEN
ncbi:MAG: hypothetical protein K2L42_06925 [Clostridia bacterium]|nr:hypothetical protein [Clostridia bacterium]